MTNNPLLLIGGPDSGKTNFLARLWLALGQKGYMLKPKARPDDLRYVESLVDHLLQGEFAPRSSSDDEPRPFVLEVTPENSTQTVALTIPDVRGELWKSAVVNAELPSDWMDRLKASASALLFIRVHSDQNVEPMDWVTAKKQLEHERAEPVDAEELPTQVMLCELLRFLELTLATTRAGRRPRVAILVTAWDLLDAEAQEAGPAAYLRRQFPLLAGRILDCEKLEIAVFGVSVLGGDLETDDAFRKQFLAGTDAEGCGYVVRHDAAGSVRSLDITDPVIWALDLLPQK